MEYFRIAVQVYVAIGIGLACIALIVTCRAAFTRAKQTALDPSPLSEFRLGGSKGRDAPHQGQEIPVAIRAPFVRR